MAFTPVSLLDSYEQQGQVIEQRKLADLQQQQVRQGLLAKLQEAQRQESLRRAVAGAGGDPEKALAAALQAGDVESAKQLAPIVKMAQESRQREETPRLLSQIMQQQPQAATAAPQELGMGQPVAQAGDAPAAPTGQQGRIQQLQAMTLIPQVANNPVVMQRLQAEIDKLQAAADAPPKKRDRIDGENLVQEEFTGGQWAEVGRGPRFARQVAPVVTVQPNKPGPLVPIRRADGKIVYAPRSEAVGQEVGGRTTDININRQVQQLGRDFEKAGLPQMIPVVERAMQITPQQAAFITGPGAMLPDRAVPQDVREARQALSKLFNITLKDRSGAAVTYQELERLKTEFGQGLIKTPQQLLTAIRDARGIVESHYTGVGASYGKEALDAYNANLEAIGGAPFRVTGPGARLTPAQPGAPTQAAGPSEGQEAKSKSGRDMVFRGGKWIYK